MTVKGFDIDMKNLGTFFKADDNNSSDLVEFKI